MNGLSFASSLLTHLYWPVVVAGALVLFRKPLTGLIGRVRRYEGLGQKLEFGELLAEAEDSVGKVAQGVAIDNAPDGQVETEPSPLTRQAEANPSFVVLQAWEQLAAAVAELAEVALHSQKAAQWNSSRTLPQLVQREVLSSDFANAINELRILRNQVAHGQSNPTPGEALVYAQSVLILTATLRTITARLHNPPPTTGV